MDDGGGVLIIIVIIIFVIFFAISFSKREAKNIEKHKKYRRMEKKAFRNKKDNIRKTNKVQSKNKLSFLNKFRRFFSRNTNYNKNENSIIDENTNTDNSGKFSAVIKKIKLPTLFNRGSIILVNILYDNLFYKDHCCLKYSKSIKRMNLKEENVIIFTAKNGRHLDLTNSKISEKEINIISIIRRVNRRI